jgi:small neutral amino acid transporter SnatA (MarC family)
MDDLIATFIFFFAVIDPIGTVPVFIAITSRYEDKIKRQIAVKATAALSGVLNALYDLHFPLLSVENLETILDSRK